MRRRLVLVISVLLTVALEIDQCRAAADDGRAIFHHGGVLAVLAADSVVAVGIPALRLICRKQLFRQVAVVRWLRWLRSLAA